jgi:type IV secretory pathway VirB3-like protein
MRISKFHHSLNIQSKIMGVDPKFFSFECGICLCVLIFKFYAFLAVVPFLHLTLRWISSKDIQIILIYKQYIREVDFWDPWIHYESVCNREFGFGRGIFK